MKLVFIILGIAFFYLTAYALCRSAADADRQAELEWARFQSRKESEQL